MDYTKDMVRVIRENAESTAETIQGVFLALQEDIRQKVNKLETSITYVDNKHERHNATAAEVKRIKELLEQNARLTNDYMLSVDKKFNEMRGQIAQIHKLMQDNTAFEATFRAAINKSIEGHESDIAILRSRIKVLEVANEYLITPKKTLWQRIMEW